MTTNPRPLDWGKDDSHLQNLERRLEALLSLPEYSSDDRRLARVYVGFGRLLEARLDPKLARYLALAEQYLSTGVFSDELENVSRELGFVSQQLALQEWRSGIQTDQPFIYQLLESCTRRKFAVHPATDVEPVAWMAAAGVSTDDISYVVCAVYPELANP